MFCFLTLSTSAFQLEYCSLVVPDIDRNCAHKYLLSTTIAHIFTVFWKQMNLKIKIELKGFLKCHFLFLWRVTILYLLLLPLYLLLLHCLRKITGEQPAKAKLTSFLYVELGPGSNSELGIQEDTLRNVQYRFGTPKRVSLLFVE